MIPILSAAHIRAADRHTISGGIASTELMERAGKACADRLVQWHRNGLFGRGSDVKFLVVAGMGNNGGDGLVIALALAAAGLAVRVVRILHRDKASEDHQHFLQRLKDTSIPVEDISEGGAVNIHDDEVVVDALFGTGLSHPLDGWLTLLVREFNAARRGVISIDMPSGLFADDNSGNDLSAVVKASVTLTFEIPRLAHMMPDLRPWVGRIEVVPIGLDSAFIQDQKTRHYLIEERDVVELLPARPWNGHKGIFGHAFIMGGSTGKAGAAIMAVQAALRSGAGLVSAHVPSGVLPFVQTAAPEAMCIPDTSDHLESLPELDPYSAIGVGPGMGTFDETATLLKLIIQEVRSHLVLDADALNILAANPTWCSFLPANTILTPHPKEFDRLHGSPSISDQERLERASEMAVRHHCIVILKSSITSVCNSDGKVFFNSTGNPGMARGGSGDVLTGLITGLLAQRISPLQAALLGVYVHGLAGDIAARHKGMDGMTAMDLVHALPSAWQQLRNASEEIGGIALSLPQHFRGTF